ncbi:MAG: roadblock/LC7 domain-containing protein [Planctomycetota bacterium]|jgi:predicted regulator of Ras-like GTPase activity (Roadblock/LC7/MglB family)
MAKAASADKRRVYFARDIHQMNLVLGKFLNKSGAETVLLVNEAGHLVARQGTQSPASEDTITALVAGTFAASQAMAGMLGAEEFSSLIPRGGGGHLLLLRAGEHALLAVAFADSVSATVVRTYALEAIRRLDALLAKSGKSKAGSTERIQPEKFDGEIGGALSDVFG